MMSDTVNPINNNTNINNYELTLYDKLNLLSNEISDHTVVLYTSIHNNNSNNNKKEQIEKELKELKELAFQERSPEASYNLKLFRKYNELVHIYMKEKATNNNTNKSSIIGS